jgi:thiamine-phosphate diphosphorylase
LIICLVTDRRRLAGADASAEDARRCLVAQARYAVDAGIDIVHIRERDLEAAALAALVSEILAATRGSATRVVVNDRLDVALACGAHGVHLRGDSISPAAARRLAPAGLLIGRSVHAVDDIAQADGADYVIAGTVFASASKPDASTLLGVDGLRAIVRAAPVPVLAIGGVTAERITSIADAGAAGIAAIGLFFDEPDRSGESHCRPSAMDRTVASLRERFDRVKAAP